jgi:hypothetical protein
MDTLSLAAVPCLFAAFALLSNINDALHQVKASKYQLQSLRNAATELVNALNIKYNASQLSETSTSGPLKQLDMSV